MSLDPSIPAMHCPYLGLAEDSDSWATFPTVDNHCHRPAPPKPVALNHQKHTCLTEDYIECQVFKAETWRGPLPDDLQPHWARSLSNWQRWLIGGGVTVIALIIGALLLRSAAGDGGLLGTGITETPTPTHTALSADPTATPSPPSVSAASTTTAEPTSAVTPTSTVTATDSPTATPTSTATATPDYAAEAVLGFDTNLRVGPSLEHRVLELVEADTMLAVLGRDFDGFWLHVRTPDNVQGWISTRQIASDLDVPSLPIVEDYPTPAVTSTLTPSPTPGAATPTVTPQP